MGKYLNLAFLLLKHLIALSALEQCSALLSSFTFSVDENIFNTLYFYLNVTCNQTES